MNRRDERRWRQVDRGIAVDLTPFIAKETDWKVQGYSDSMMSLG